jgi:hypothetical protein
MVGPEKKQFELLTALQIVYEDASKNVSDLKTRQWNLTSFAYLGVAGVFALAHLHQAILVVLLSGFLFAMFSFGLHRCQNNLNDFRNCLTKTTLYFPEEVQNLLVSNDKHKMVPDEGSLIVGLIVAHAAACIVAIAQAFKVFEQ